MSTRNGVLNVKNESSQSKVRLQNLSLSLSLSLSLRNLVISLLINAQQICEWVRSMEAGQEAGTGLILMDKKVISLQKVTVLRGALSLSLSPILSPLPSLSLHVHVVLVQLLDLLLLLNPLLLNPLLLNPLLNLNQQQRFMGLQVEKI
jgi:hypothetical protein